jgi:hypothetical protein
MKAVFVGGGPTVRGSRLLRLAWASCLTVLLGSGAVRAQANGTTVAVLQLAAPTSTEFILRGTLPVPPQVFPRADGRSPFMVRSFGGELVAAQTERVSSYPRESDGADVVEVLARVQRDPSVAPGTYVQFDVVLQPCEFRRPRLTAPVAALKQLPWGIQLRADDVFGNPYRADIHLGKYGARIERFGRHVFQERLHTFLEPIAPVGPPTATLPHLMGVHTYASYWAMENVITLDLRIHNAASGLDKSPSVHADDAQKRMYFDELELVLPAGWTVLQDYEDPFFGPTTQRGTKSFTGLVEPNPDGTYHVIPQQGQFERRLALCPVGNEARAREFLDQAFLGFCKRGTNSAGQPYWSWWNPQTARYFPQRYLMPMISHLSESSMRTSLQNEYSQFRSYLLSGTTPGVMPVIFPNLGWAHPWGVQYGGMTSGSEIYLYDGHAVAVTASRPGYRMLELRHRMYTDRMPDALFNLDGDPTSMHDWIVQGPQFDYVPSMFFQTVITGYDMFGFDVASSQHVDFAASNGLAPAYEDDLLDFKPIDLAHMTRYTNAPKVLAWLGNDAMAKDDLTMQAEICRLSYHHLPNTAGGTAIVSGMLSSIQWVGAHPGKGFAFGRSHGWTIDAMCAAYSLQKPGWRAQARDWFDRVTLLVGQGQASCSGVIQAQQSQKFLSNLHRARQSIEQAIVENGLWSIRESVYRGVDAPRLADVGNTLARSCYSMIGFPGWSQTLNGPWSICAVGPVNIQLPLYCTSLPAGGTDGITDEFQTWSSFAYGYELTGDPLFLERAMDMASPSYTDFHAAMHFGNFSANLENRYAAMALSEQITYP